MFKRAKTSPPADGKAADEEKTDPGGEGAYHGAAAEQAVLRTYEREKCRRRRSGRIWGGIYFVFQLAAIAAGAAATILATQKSHIGAAGAAAAATLASTVLAVLKPRESWKRQAHAAHRLLVEQLRYANRFGVYGGANPIEGKQSPPITPPADAAAVAPPDATTSPASASSPVAPLEQFLANCEAIIRDAWAQEEASAPAPTSKTPPAAQATDNDS